MADKKFGQKRVCSNCETKFYDLNKNSPLTCPHCTSEIVIENELSNYSTSQVVEEQKKDHKDEFDGIEDSDNSNDDDVISLDEAVVEEEDKN